MLGNKIFHSDLKVVIQLQVYIFKSEEANVKVYIHPKKYSEKGFDSHKNCLTDNLLRYITLELDECPGFSRQLKTNMTRFLL